MRIAGKILKMRKRAEKMPLIGSHQWIDLVDLAMHRAIARKIRREPKLFARAKRTLARWEKVNRACSPTLREWKDILRTQERESVLRILTRADEECTRLRSTAPFCGILTQREVEAIWVRYDKAPIGKSAAQSR